MGFQSYITVIVGEDPLTIVDSFLPGIPLSNKSYFVDVDVTSSEPVETNFTFTFNQRLEYNVEVSLCSDQGIYNIDTGDYNNCFKSVNCLTANQTEY
jgi:hypothetical protein